MRKAFSIQRKRSGKGGRKRPGGRIRECKPLLTPEGMLFRDLSFAYAPTGFTWWDRFVLNKKHKKALRLARKEGLSLLAASERVAFDLHRYYRVDPDAIQIQGL